MSACLLAENCGERWCDGVRGIIRGELALLGSAVCLWLDELGTEGKNALSPIEALNRVFERKRKYTE